jgi:hypothetical protein
MLGLGITDWWSGFYGNHQIVSVSIRFIHLTALILGGGTALFVDRRILRAMRADAEVRAATLDMLAKAHSLVVPWIGVLAVSGILLTAADAQTFLGSRVFWIKMLLIALLLGNGTLLLILERKLPGNADLAAWRPLGIVSTVSAVLWLITLFVGTLLTVAA